MLQLFLNPYQYVEPTSSSSSTFDVVSRQKCIVQPPTPTTDESLSLWFISPSVYLSATKRGKSNIREKSEKDGIMREEDQMDSYYVVPVRLVICAIGGRYRVHVVIIGIFRKRCVCLTLTVVCIRA